MQLQHVFYIQGDVSIHNIVVGQLYHFLNALVECLLVESKANSNQSY
jgi:hypothetical protein